MSELCFVLPTGEVVDFQMYDGAVLPDVVPHDEWAGIYATVRVVVAQEDAKRPASGGPAPADVQYEDEYLLDEEGNVVGVQSVPTASAGTGPPPFQRNQRGRSCFKIL